MAAPHTVWCVLLFLTCLPWQARAAQIWATWDLDLAGHEPPTHFVLSVTSPTGAPVPPAMDIPWAGCTTVPGAQHCTPIGCPSTGTYAFVVRASYTEGVSQPSNLAECRIVAQQCACVTGAAISLPPSARPIAPPRPPPITTPPFILSIDPATLNLQPVGAIPQTSTIPPLPASRDT